MKMLGSSTKRLSSENQRLLYRSCVVAIATFGFHLWYTEKGRYKALLTHLNKMQWRSAMWITSAFNTTPTVTAEGIAGLMPVHIMLTRLHQCSIGRAATLLRTHPLHALLGCRQGQGREQHKMS